MKKTPLVFYDEYHHAVGDRNALARQRAYAQSRHAMTANGSWQITERFDDRFDTQVGGFMKLAKQWVDDNGQPQSNLLLTMGGIMSLPTIDRPAAIIDYKENGRAYTLEEAEAEGAEFAPVVIRLRERIAHHQLIKPASQIQ